MADAKVFWSTKRAPGSAPVASNVPGASGVPSASDAQDTSDAPAAPAASFPERCKLFHMC
jgi:hypothetical protein